MNRRKLWILVFGIWLSSSFAFFLGAWYDDIFRAWFWETFNMFDMAHAASYIFRFILDMLQLGALITFLSIFTWYYEEKKHIRNKILDEIGFRWLKDRYFLLPKNRKD